MLTSGAEIGSAAIATVPYSSITSRESAALAYSSLLVEHPSAMLVKTQTLNRLIATFPVSGSVL